MAPVQFFEPASVEARIKEKVEALFHNPISKDGELSLFYKNIALELQVFSELLLQVKDDTLTKFLIALQKTVSIFAEDLDSYPACRSAKIKMIPELEKRVFEVLQQTSGEIRNYTISIFRLVLQAAKEMSEEILTAHPLAADSAIKIRADEVLARLHSP